MSRQCIRRGTLRRVLTACVVGLAPLTWAPGQAATGPARELRVCADPADLPYSDDRGGGFENRIAEVLAHELRAGLRYAWQPQRRGFLRRGLQSGACDVVIGVPHGLPGVLSTRPYYRSRYAFVTRRGAHHMPADFDDAVWRSLRVGLAVLGSDGANTPPAMALARRGLGDRVTGYPVLPAAAGDRAPQSRPVDAVAAGDVDLAIVWGPAAGWFARAHGARLDVALVPDDPQQPQLAFEYAIAVGVRRGDAALRDELQRALDRRADDVAAILREFSVPLAASAASSASGHAAAFSGDS